jgi:hypothetical protein
MLPTNPDAPAAEAGRRVLKAMRSAVASRTG